METGRIRHLDYCKGIAIILVVAGHYFPPESPEAWKAIRGIIYTFHMPVFFFVSGYFFLGEMRRGSGLTATLKKKAVRLLIPFASIALIFLLIKFAASLVVKLEHGLEAGTVWNAIIDPVNSYVPLIWFMQALFIMFMLFTLLNGLCRLPPPMIFAVSVCLSFLPSPAYFSIDQVFANMQFFCFGYLVNQYAPALGEYPGRLAAALPLFLINAYWLLHNPDHALARLFSAYLGILSVLCLSGIMSGSKHRIFAGIEKAGLYSMGIYLLHPFFESVIRILYYQVFKLPPAYFWFGFIAGIIAGIVPSAILEACFLRRNSFTRKYLLGLGRDI